MLSRNIAMYKVRDFKFLKEAENESQRWAKSKFKLQGAVVMNMIIEVVGINDADNDDVEDPYKLYKV